MIGFFPMKSISVVIPCRNAGGTLGACLAALGRQTEKPLEVIVVDGASTDGSREVAARFPVTLIASPEPLSAGKARNLGMSRARGGIIAFTDADGIPDDNWIAAIGRAFARAPDASGAGGAILDGSGGIAGRLEYLSNFSEFIPSRRPAVVPTVPTLNVAYRREAIAGMEFIPTTAGEDTMFNAGLAARGGWLVFDPSIRVTHRPARRGLPSFFRNQYRCGIAFVYPRMRYRLRGEALLRHPGLLLFMPRMGVLFARYLFTRQCVPFIVLLPLLAAGEICRTVGILKGRRMRGYGEA